MLVVSYGSREAAIVDALACSRDYETRILVVDKQRNPFNIERAFRHVVLPDLNVVDAEDKVILGVDPLAVDVVACRFLDLDPFEVEHLNLVSEDRGEKLEDFMERMEVVEI